MPSWTGWTPGPGIRDPARMVATPDLTRSLSRPNLQANGGPSRHSPQPQPGLMQIRMRMAVPPWQNLQNLQQAANMLRQERPTLSITSGVYSHARRRGWD